MFYECRLSRLPQITKCYTVTRNTVWQIAEPENLLIFIREGSCIMEAEGEHHLLSAGDVIFLPQRCAYLRRSVEGGMCTMTYVHFFLSEPPLGKEDGAVQRALAKQKEEADKELLSGNRPPLYETVYLSGVCRGGMAEISDILSGIHLISARKPVTGMLDASARLCMILSHLAGKTAETLLHASSVQTSQEVPPKLRRAVGYIVRHYSEPISLQDVARHCNVSSQQMIRYFKGAFGKTPNRYIAEYKAARAKELLFNEQQLTVKEVAAELGFDNQHYFSRFFKAVTGETPGAYRQRTVHYAMREKQAEKA